MSMLRKSARMMEYFSEKHGHVFFVLSHTIASEGIPFTASTSVWQKKRNLFFVETTGEFLLNVYKVQGMSFLWKHFWWQLALFNKHSKSNEAIDLYKLK